MTPDERRVSAALACIAIVVGLGSAGCAARQPRLQLPSSPGHPWPDAAAAWIEATAACRGIRTMSAELALSGHADRQAIRGRALVGLAPGAVRLEGLAPLGAPAFILAASGSDATLLLPRDRAVLRDTSAAPVMDALVGVPLDADDLRATLTGCILPAPGAGAGRLFDASTAAIELSGATAFLRKARDGRWRVFAARRDGWQIEYAWGTGRVPETVRLWRDGPAARVDVSARSSQVDLNIELRPEVFRVEVPPDARPITVDELRASGPLGRPAAGAS